MDLTGAQLKTLLEKQFDGGNGILQVSSGFTYTCTASAAVNSKVSAMALNGVPIAAGQRPTA